MTTSTSRHSSSSGQPRFDPRQAGSSVLAWRFDIGGRTCHIRSSGRVDGDFCVTEPEADLEDRQRRIVDADWTWFRQVHGTETVVVDQPGQFAGTQADAGLTTAPMAPVAVTTADCAPLVLVGSIGVAVVHAGWRGALAGIVEGAAAGLRQAGADPVATILGPCIGPAHYEFGPADLDAMVGCFGPTVIGETGLGTPALDLPEVIRVACSRAGWPAPERPPCTSDPAFHSHRVRRDSGRQTTVAWLEDHS